MPSRVSYAGPPTGRPPYHVPAGHHSTSHAPDSVGGEGSAHPPPSAHGSSKDPVDSNAPQQDSTVRPTVGQPSSSSQQPRASATHSSSSAHPPAHQTGQTSAHGRGNASPPFSSHTPPQQQPSSAQPSSARHRVTATQRMGGSSGSPNNTVGTNSATHSLNLAHPSHHPTEQKLGDYMISETIGRGSFGKVKRGRHIAIHENVAIKILNYEKLKIAKMDKKIFREIKILRLFSHPNICRLYDVIQTPTDIYLIMEHVEGGELYDFIVQKGRVPEAEARYIFQQLVCALEYCHHYRVVHRDLKPENILLGPGLQVKLIDFGLSNIMQDGLFLATSCGSANYAAPEVISGKLYCGPEVDVWSCGVILYALLCGCLPFDEDAAPELFAKIRKGKYEIPSHMSKPTADLISKLLCVDPLQRLTIPQIRDNEWFNIHLPPRLSYPSSIACVGEDHQHRVQSTVVSEVARRLNVRDKEVYLQLDAGTGPGYTAYHILVDALQRRHIAQEHRLLMLEEEKEKEKAAQNSANSAEGSGHHHRRIFDFWFPTGPNSSTTASSKTPSPPTSARHSTDAAAAAAAAAAADYTEFQRPAALQDLNLGLLLSQSPAMEVLLDRHNATETKDTYNSCSFIPASMTEGGGRAGNIVSPQPSLSSYTNRETESGQPLQIATTNRSLFGSFAISRHVETESLPNSMLIGNDLSGGPSTQCSSTGFTCAGPVGRDRSRTITSGMAQIEVPSSHGRDRHGNSPQQQSFFRSPQPLLTTPRVNGHPSSNINCGSIGGPPLVGSVASSCVAYSRSEHQFFVENNAGWRLGIMSDANAQEVLLRVYKVLKAAKMEWKVLSPFQLIARTTPETWKAVPLIESEGAPSMKSNVSSNKVKKNSPSNSPKAVKKQKTKSTMRKKRGTGEELLTTTNPPSRWRLAPSYMEALQAAEQRQNSDSSPLLGKPQTTPPPQIHDIRNSGPCDVHEVSPVGSSNTTSNQVPPMESTGPPPLAEGSHFKKHVPPPMQELEWKVEEQEEFEAHRRVGDGSRDVGSPGRFSPSNRARFHRIAPSSSEKALHSSFKPPAEATVPLSLQHSLGNSGLSPGGIRTPSHSFDQRSMNSSRLMRDHGPIPTGQSFSPSQSSYHPQMGSAYTGGSSLNRSRSNPVGSPRKLLVPTPEQRNEHTMEGSVFRATHASESPLMQTLSATSIRGNPPHRRGFGSSARSIPNASSLNNSAQALSPNGTRLLCPSSESPPKGCFFTTPSGALSAGHPNATESAFQNALEGPIPLHPHSPANSSSRWEPSMNDNLFRSPGRNCVTPDPNMLCALSPSSPRRSSLATSVPKPCILQATSEPPSVCPDDVDLIEVEDLMQGLPNAATHSSLDFAASPGMLGSTLPSNVATQVQLLPLSSPATSENPVERRTGSSEQNSLLSPPQQRLKEPASPTTMEGTQADSDEDTSEGFSTESDSETEQTGNGELSYLVQLGSQSEPAAAPEVAAAAEAAKQSVQIKIHVFRIHEKHDKGYIIDWSVVHNFVSGMDLVLRLSRDMIWLEKNDR